MTRSKYYHTVRRLFCVSLVFHWTNYLWKNGLLIDHAYLYSCANVLRILANLVFRQTFFPESAIQLREHGNRPKLSFQGGTVSRTVELKKLVVKLEGGAVSAVVAVSGVNTKPRRLFYLLGLHVDCNGGENLSGSDSAFCTLTQRVYIAAVHFCPWRDCPSC